MNYQDTFSWPDLPVEEVYRDEIKTLYSFGHYDGVGTGLVEWNNTYYWAARFDYKDNRYWLVELDPAHALRLLERGKEWARLFSSSMSWLPNGERVPDSDGPYCTKLPFKYGDDQEYNRRREFYIKWSTENKLEEPPDTAKVVGYFTNWRMK